MNMATEAPAVVTNDLVTDSGNATLQRFGCFHYGEDPEAGVLSTVHVVDGKAVANLWIKQNDIMQKVGKERVFDMAPSNSMLFGAVFAYVQTPGIADVIDRDIHLLLAFKSLATIPDAQAEGN